jgi:hypothetical protein
MRDIQYVVLEWVEDLPQVARYGFATLKHAEELGDNVRWHDRCASLEQAASAAQALNDLKQPASAARGDRVATDYQTA